MVVAAAGTAHQLYSDPNAPLPDGTAVFYRVLAYFRETNAEGLRIYGLITAAQVIPPSKDQSATLAAFEEARAVIRDEIIDANRRAAALVPLRPYDPETFARYARELIQVSNAWDDLDRHWPESSITADTLAAVVTAAPASLTILEDVIFLCACQTIPDELDEYLKNYRIGKSLDFVATFKDQLTSEQKTRDVLAVLAPQDGVVCGLIDLSTAHIIKADQHLGRQVLSVVAIATSVLLGFGLIALAVHLGTWFGFDTSQWTLKSTQWTALNGAYLLILLGVLAHWVLDRIKLNNAGSDVTPFSEWLMWLHVNEVPIVVRIATVWLLLALGVAFGTFKLAGGIQPLTYFTAGYFIDSTFDALIGRFNTFISTQDPAKKKDPQKS